jgi:transposase-like protein
MIVIMTTTTPPNTKSSFRQLLDRVRYLHRPERGDVVTPVAKEGDAALQRAEQHTAGGAIRVHNEPFIRITPKEDTTVLDVLFFGGSKRRKVFFKALNVFSGIEKLFFKLYRAGCQLFFNSASFAKLSAKEVAHRELLEQTVKVGEDAHA